MIRPCHPLLFLVLLACGVPEADPTPAHAASWDFSAVRAEPTPQPTAAPIPTITDDPNRRCSEGRRMRLVVERGPERILDIPNSAIGRRPRSVLVSRGRHAGERALPLAALLEAGDPNLTVVPCTGEPLVIDAGPLSADPDRYLVLPSRNGVLKLLDASIDSSRPMRKNLAVIRLPSRSSP